MLGGYPIDKVFLELRRGKLSDGFQSLPAPEAGFRTWMQGYYGAGMHNYYTLLRGIDGTIYHLTATGSVWEVYAP